MAVKVNLNLPASVWTASDSAALASNTLASIKLRTSKGIDANGKKFDFEGSPAMIQIKECSGNIKQNARAGKEERRRCTSESKDENNKIAARATATTKPRARTTKKQYY